MKRNTRYLVIFGVMVTPFIVACILEPQLLIVPAMLLIIAGVAKVLFLALEWADRGK